MNRNSNVYTVIYAAVLCALVAILLSAAALGLKDQQKANTDNEKKQQILMSVKTLLNKEEISFEEASQLWGELNMDDNQLAVDPQGNVLEGVNPFEITAKAQFAAGVVKPEAQLPVFVANIDGTPYYIMCMYGPGLWDAIWGYIAVKADGEVVGASFDHASETAGLGAKIKDDPNFAKSFIGKNIYTNGEFTSVAVVKAGKKSPYGGDQIDGITGATKTSDCVSVMVYESLKGYLPYLQSLQQSSACCQHEGCEGCEGCQSDSCQMAEGCCADMVKDGPDEPNPATDPLAN